MRFIADSQTSYSGSRWLRVMTEVVKCRPESSLFPVTKRAMTRVTQGTTRECTAPVRLSLWGHQKRELNVIHALKNCTI
jgi:hypothetical protein